MYRPGVGNTVGIGIGLMKKSLIEVNGFTYQSCFEVTNLVSASPTFIETVHTDSHVHTDKGHKEKARVKSPYQGHRQSLLQLA